MFSQNQPKGRRKEFLQHINTPQQQWGDNFLSEGYLEFFKDKKNWLEKNQHDLS